MANFFEDVFDFLFGWALPDPPEYQGGLELSQPKATSEPLVYGEMKNAQGVIIETFIDDDPTTGGDIVNDLLYLHVVWSVGAVESIDQIYLDDIPIKSSLHGFEDDGSGTGFAYNWDYITDTQINEGHTFTLVDDVTTKTFHGKGFAHSIIRLQYSPEHVNHLPKITADIKGRVGLNDLSGGTTTTATSNPSIILWDYLTNTDYGRGIDVTQLNKPSFVTERDFADTSVYTDNTNTVQKKIMTINTAFNCNDKLIDNIQTIMKGCRGFMPYIDGEFHFIIERDRSVEAFEFNDNNRLSNFVVSDNEISDRYNRVTITFSDIEQKGKSATAIYPVDNTEYQTYLAEDAGVKLESSLTIDTINNYAEALQMAEIILKRSRNALKVKTAAGSEAKAVSVGMVVPVSNEAFGMVSKPFIVVNRTKDADSVYKFELLEYQASIYPWVAGDPQVIPDSSVSEYWKVTAPTNVAVSYLTDGTGQAVITWDSDAAEFITSIGGWGGSVLNSSKTSSKTFKVDNLENGSYDFKVIAVNKLGYKSTASVLNFTINVPEVPVLVTDASNFEISVVPSITDSEVNAVFELRTSLSSNMASPTYHGQSNAFTLIKLKAGTTYYVQVRTIGKSGVSAWSAAQAVTTTNDSTDLTDVLGDAYPTESGTNTWSQTQNFSSEINVNGGVDTTSSDMFFRRAGTTKLALQSDKILAFDDIVPSSSVTYDLGTAASQFRNIYGQTLYENGVDLGSKYLGVNAPVGHVHIHDTRADGDVLPADFNEKQMTVSFTDDIAGSPNLWDGVITVKGWSDGYKAWQLISDSNSTTHNSDLFFRSGNTSWGTLQKVWTDYNDGAGSGLDADLLDGIDSSQFLRSDVGTVKTSGNLKFNDNISLNFGTDNDTEIFNNGSGLYVDINNGQNIFIRDGNSSNSARFTFDVDTGNLTATTFTGNATNANNLGNRPAADYVQAVFSNGYEGLGVNGNVTTFMRTPIEGLIPYNGDGGAHESSLGTSTWKFQNIHGVNLYGQTLYENGIDIANKYIGLADLDYNSSALYAVAFKAIDEFDQWLKSGDADTSPYTTVTESIATGFINTTILQANILAADSANVNFLHANIIEAGTIVTEKLNVTARRELINNFSTSGSLDGYTSSVGTLVDEVQLDGVTVTTQKVTTSSSATTFSQWINDIDHNAIYEVTLSIYSDHPDTTGTRYFGMKANSGKDGSGTNMEVYHLPDGDVTKSESNTNPYFWFGDVYEGSWRHMRAYVIGANVDLKTVPSNLNVSRNFVLHAGAKSFQLRWLNYGNSPTSVTNHFYNPNVTKLGAGQIHAQSIVANSITANELAANTITANEIQSNIIFGVNATFTGDITGASGTFSGNLSAATITGGTINGSTINGSTIQNATDNVSTDRTLINDDGFTHWAQGVTEVVVAIGSANGFRGVSPALLEFGNLAYDSKIIKAFNNSALENTYIRNYGSGKAAHIQALNTALTIKSTTAPAADFEVNSGYAPFTVNSTNLVTNLNAQYINGVTENNFGRLNVSRAWTANQVYTTSLRMDDNAELYFGTGNDAYAYHSGSHFYIDNNTGDMNFRNYATNGDINFQTKRSNGNFATAIQMNTATDASVGLYHNGLVKLLTSSTGIDVTGDVKQNGVTLDNTYSPKGNTFTQSESAGLWKDKETGYTRQWGYISVISNGNGTKTFPVAFTTCLGVSVTSVSGRNEGSNYTNTMYSTTSVTGAFGNTSFKYTHSSEGEGLYWEAWGTIA